MIAIDTNLLVYAHRRDSPWHRAAAGLMRRLAEGHEAWAIPWPCVHEFFAIVTHPRIYQPPSPVEVAIAQVEAWMESPSLVLLAEGPTHWESLRALLADGRVSGPRVHDARIAALCAQYRVRELWSADRDFASIGGVRTKNPLLPA